MPELPEVETTRRGLLPHAAGRRIAAMVVRERRLRWPLAAGVEERLQGRGIVTLERRGKYLLFRLDSGDTLILHLGMSGSIRVLEKNIPPGKHDHFDLLLDDGRCLRYTDPRRFGAAILTESDPLRHPLLASLGVEPLTDELTAKRMRQLFAGSRQAIKLVLMDSHRIVGVGNIYANESLFRAGIRPSAPAGRVSLARLEKLVAAVKETLAAAIEAGGSTLRDFVGGDGKPGYFQQQYFVYDRTNLPCRLCGTPIRQSRLGQRGTFYCNKCQK